MKTNPFAHFPKMRKCKSFASVGKTMLGVGWNGWVALCFIEKRQIKTNLRLPVFGNEQKTKKEMKESKNPQLPEQAKSSRNLRIFWPTLFFFSLPSVSFPLQWALCIGPS